MTEPTPEPWDRQEGESARAFAAFVAYRDLGSSRSLSRAASELPVGRDLLARWSREWGWQARTRAWDAHLDEVRQRAITDETEAMAVRHAREAQEAQSAAMGPVRAVLERMGTEDARRALTGLPIVELVTLALSAARHLPALQAAERLARGEPTATSEHGVASELPADHLDGVLAALDRAGLHVLSSADADAEKAAD